MTKKGNSKIWKSKAIIMKIAGLIQTHKLAYSGADLNDNRHVCFKIPKNSIPYEIYSPFVDVIWNGNCS